MAVVIPYTKQTWTDGVSSCSAARNNVHEDGINDAHYQPAVRVFHNAAQSIADNTITTVAFNSERYDQAGNVASTQHDTVTNNSRLTCRHAGVYLITFHGEWPSVGGAGTYECWIRLNATTDIAVGMVSGVDSAVTTQHKSFVSTTYALAVNDFVEVRVRQITTAARNLNSTGNYSPEFMMHRVG